MALLMFFGGQLHIYYSLNLYIFLIFISAYPSSFKLSKDLFNYLYPCFIIVLLIYTFSNANYAKMIGLRQSETVQYKFAAIINEKQNPTILTYDFIDTGFYMAANTLPNHKYFILTNIETFKENREEQKSYLESGEIDFVICFNIENNIPPEIDNYLLIKTFYQEDCCYYYLYEKKKH